MIEHIRSAYRRLEKWARRSTRIDRFVRLEITVLEERATPAVLVAYVPMIQPPEIVLIAPAPTIAPALTTTAETSVRSDLFGAGDAMETREPDVFDNWFDQAESPREENTTPAKFATPELPPSPPEGESNLVSAVFEAEAAGE